MKYFITLFLLAGGIMAAEKPIEDFVEQMHWSGQASIRIEQQKKTIYFDPYNLTDSIPADIIFITHSHRDHFSPNDLDKIITAKTKVIAPKNCEKDIEELNYENIIFIEPGQQLTVDSIQVKAVPAYNIHKTRFHPKSNHWCGYVVTFGKITLYHAGDTERIPEMKDIDCDIALLPLGQTYTMDSVESATQAALDIQPKIAIPIHFGMYEGSEQDARTFTKLLIGKIEVRILSRE